MRPFSVVSCGCDAADAHVRAVVVVSSEPLRREILGLFDGFDDVLVQPFVPDGAVVTLDVGPRHCPRTSGGLWLDAAAGRVGYAGW